MQKPEVMLQFLFDQQSILFADLIQHLLFNVDV